MWGEQTAIFRFKFSSFQHGVFLTVCVGGGGWRVGRNGKEKGGKKNLAFHKGAVTFSNVRTCSLLSPAFARRRIPRSIGEEKGQR